MCRWGKFKKYNEIAISLDYLTMNLVTYIWIPLYSIYIKIFQTLQGQILMFRNILIPKETEHVDINIYV